MSDEEDLLFAIANDECGVVVLPRCGEVIYRAICDDLVCRDTEGHLQLTVLGWAELDKIVRRQEDGAS